jgi:PEP-CTERM motif
MTITHRTAKLCPALLAFVATLVGGVAHGYTVGFKPIAGAQGSPFSNYAEGGFSVNNIAGTWKVGQNSGNPLPSIFGEPPALATVRVTNSVTGLFTFSSAQLAGNNSTTATFTIEGFRNNVSQYSIPGTLNLAGLYFTINSPNPATILDRLDIAVSGNSATTFNVDNISVNQVPEPAALALIAMGALFGFSIRRSRRAAI